MNQKVMVKKWWDQLENEQQIFLQSELVDFISITPQKFLFTKNFLHQKYVVEGLSSSEIAAQTFSSRATVTKRLKEFNIPLKTITRRETGGQVYGYRRYLGMSIPVKKEQRVINQINSYRSRGYSYQRIADLLNKSGVKTKHDNGVWFSKVIRQIHRRSQCDI